MKVLLFRMEKKLFGIPIDEIKELIRVKELEVIPRSPKWVKGIINYRGKILPMVSLSSLLQIDEPDRIIGVASSAPYILGIGGIEGIYDIEVRTEKVNISGSDYLLGIGEYNQRLVLILNIENLVERDKRRKLHSILKRVK